VKKTMPESAERINKKQIYFIYLHVLLRYEGFRKYNFFSLG